MKNTAPYHWIKRIEEALEERKAIPLWSTPLFPWDECVSRLRETLNFKEFTFFPHRTDWLASSDILAGFGNRPVIIPIDLSPLNQSAYWIMSREDVIKFASMTLTPESKMRGFSEFSLGESYYHFLSLELLAAIDQLHPFGALSIKRGRDLPLPDEKALCMDIQITLSDQILWGRLVCPASLHAAFKTHFAQSRPQLNTSQLAQNVEVSLRLEIGSSNLTLSKWKEIACGDLLLLDRCTFEPKTQRGSVTIVLEQTPLFSARLKDGDLKILDYVYYYEENTTMKNSHPGDEDEQREEEFLANDEEMLLNDEVSDESLTTENSHLWSTKSEGNGTLEKMISDKEIPITLTVEIARLQITVEKLLQLQPGNLLNLAVHPNEGVYLTVQGKRVAKGELVHLGEALGVKILNIHE